MTQIAYKGSLKMCFECFQQKGINGTSSDKCYLVLWVLGTFSLIPSLQSLTCGMCMDIFPLQWSSTGPEHGTMKQCRSSNCSLVSVLLWGTETKQLLLSLYSAGIQKLKVFLMHCFALLVKIWPIFFFLQNQESGFTTFMRTLRERDHERVGKKKDEL